MSSSLTHKFEHLSQDYFLSAQSFLTMKETNNKIDDKKPQPTKNMRTSSSPIPNTKLPPMDDTGVNLNSNLTQEATFSNVISDFTNQNLVVGHPSTLPLS